MGMDWINALAAQDNSFESQLAQRDLTKKLALLQSVQAQKQAQAEKQREFDERQADTQARMAETTRLRDDAANDRKTAEKRNRYNTVHDNLKPGDRMKKGPDMDLMNEFGTGNQFSPATDDPDALIYQEAAWKQAQLDHEKAGKLKDAQEQRAIEDQKAQREAEKRDAERLKFQRDAADRAAKNFDTKIKDLATKQKELGPQGWQIAHARANERLKVMEKTPGWFTDDPDVMGQKRAAVVDEEVDKELAKKQIITQGAPSATSVVNKQESLDHKYWRLNGSVGPEPK